MGPKKAKEIQQFCSMLAKQNKTKNAPTEVIRLWTDRKDIRKHQSTSRLVHYNSARLLYQFRSIPCVTKENRPFYQYGGHIELIRFKEYYRMPRGHEHISFVFSSASLDIFY